MQRVKVPGVGVVNFPDDMSREEILQVIEYEFLPSLRQGPGGGLPKKK